jgi:hypothetical protein
VKPVVAEVVSVLVIGLVSSRLEVALLGKVREVLNMLARLNLRSPFFQYW